MGSLSPVHWAIVIVVVLLLFGSRKLPDMARGLGQSMRILKAETRGLQDDDKSHTAHTSAGESGSSASTPTSPTTPERSNGTARPAAGAERPPSAERDAS